MIDITQNTEIQDNAKRQLELQRDVGLITPFVNGKSMSQLCNIRKSKKSDATYMISTE